MIFRLMALLLLLPSACAEPDAPRVASQPLFARVQRVGMAGGASASRCALGPELRPAFGCLEELRLRKLEPADPQPNQLTFQVRPALRGRQVVAARSVRRRDEYWRTPLPSLLVRLNGPRVVIPAPTAEGRRSKVRFYEVRPAESTRTSAPILATEGARLDGSFGLDLAGLEDAGPAIEFRIVALVPGREPEPLLARRVDASSEGGRWLDYRIDLSQFAGERVALRLTTSVASTTSSSAGRSRSFPVWSVPVLMEPAADPELPNLVLVSLDTLRADHLGALGSSIAATPHLDRFAAQAAVFENTMATFPSTTASHMSMFTGTYPNVHEVTSTMRQLDEGIPMLTEMVAAGGWRTHAVTEDGMLHAVGGFARGFDGYEELRGSASEPTPGRMEQVIDQGLGWLDEHRRDRSFLFLHTYQVHSPYLPPARFDHFQRDTSDLTMPEARAAYLGEVAYADSEMQRLLDGLRDLGILEKTIVIVTSDHGEGFGVHSVGHNASLYEPELHVPLLIRAPGRLAPGR